MPLCQKCGITIQVATTKKNLPAGATAQLGKGNIYAVAYSPDGMHIAAASAVDTWLYHVEHEEVRMFPAINTDAVGSLSFSPDRKTLATENWYGTVLLWDMSLLD